MNSRGDPFVLNVIVCGFFKYTGLDLAYLPNPCLGSIGIVTVIEYTAEGYEMMTISIQIRNRAKLLCRKNFRPQVLCRLQGILSSY